jgi:hypothetical protein
VASEALAAHGGHFTVSKGIGHAMKATITTVGRSVERQIGGVPHDSITGSYLLSRGVSGDVRDSG